MRGSQVGDLRVWWIPQVPGKPFFVNVPDLVTARLIVNVLADYDQFQLDHNIKGDYCNVGGISVYEDFGDGEMCWTDLEDDELEVV
jgi:hypothetical protein